MMEVPASNILYSLGFAVGRTIIERSTLCVLRSHHESLPTHHKSEWVHQSGRAVCIANPVQWGPRHDR
jgi:hypothetical protein